MRRAQKEAQKELKRKSTEEGFLDSRKYDAESSKGSSKGVQKEDYGRMIIWIAENIRKYQKIHENI